MKKFLAIVIAIMLFPFSVFAANVDLVVRPAAIKFSKDITAMTKGDAVRVYAQVSNLGTEDATGNALFYLDVNQIADSQVSVRANGLDDDVFADFVVPDHDFRIYIELKNVSPIDADLSNNQALSVFIHPVDPPPPPPPPKTVVVVPAQPVATKPVVKPEVKKVVTPAPVIAPIVAPKEAASELITDFYKSPVIESLGIVKINAQQVNWNTYFFTFATNVKDLDQGKLQYSWDYGDGKTSSLIGNHSFPRSGDYYVNLKVKGPWNNDLNDYVTVHVNFWSVYNYWLWLIVLAIILLLFLYGTGFRRHQEPGELEESEKRREKKQPKIRQENKE